MCEGGRVEQVIRHLRVGLTADRQEPRQAGRQAGPGGAHAHPALPSAWLVWLGGRGGEQSEIQRQCWTLPALRLAALLCCAPTALIDATQRNVALCSTTLSPSHPCTLISCQGAPSGVSTSIPTRSRSRYKTQQSERGESHIALLFSCCCCLSDGMASSLTSMMVMMMIVLLC